MLKFTDSLSAEGKSCDQGSRALVDPVPESSTSTHYGQTPPAPHALEVDVQRLLLGINELRFSALEVRRVSNGVCLCGTVRVRDQKDVIKAEEVACLPGVLSVINRLVVQLDETPLADGKKDRAEVEDDRFAELQFGNSIR